MTDTFTASNGIKVGTDARGAIRVYRQAERALTLYDLDEIDGLREFFRAEEDQRLGRWRWPKDPDYVVYAERDGLHVVLRESTGEAVKRNCLYVHDMEGQAAAEYIAAHPVEPPKPWQQPKTGEVWALSLDGDDPTAWSVNHDNVFMDADSTLDPKSRMITSGRKIWPEEA